MVTKRILLRAAFFVLAFSVSGRGVMAGDVEDVRDVIKKSFKVQSGGTLYLDADQGEIEIVTRRSNEVLVEIQMTVNVDDREQAKRVLEGYRPDFEQRGNNIFVRSQYEEQERGRWGKWRNAARLSIRITVQVPERYNIDFASGMGRVSIGSLDGNVYGRTGQGSISTGRVTGSIDVTSGTGNIDVYGAGAGAKVTTGAGNILLRNIDGQITATTGAGDITAEISAQPRENSRITTGAGSVHVAVNEGIRLDVDAVTSVGSADTDLPLSVSGKWMGKTIEGRLNGGGPQLHMRVGFGNVSIKRL